MSKSGRSSHHGVMSAVAVAIAAVALSAGPVRAQSQQSLSEFPQVEQGRSAQAELTERLNSVRNVADSLQEKIAGATRRLEQVADANPNEMVTQINTTFDEFRADIQGIIDETSPTSELSDALGRALQRTTVFRNDLAQKPASHPNRDERLAQLDAILQTYEKLKADLDSRRANASNALFELSKQQNLIVEQVMIDQIVKAQEALRDVVMGLSDLADSLTNLKPPALNEDALQN